MDLGLLMAKESLSVSPLSGSGSCSGPGKTGVPWSWLTLSMNSATTVTMDFSAQTD